MKLFELLNLVINGYDVLILEEANWEGKLILIY
jgi:hypothetical protein